MMDKPATMELDSPFTMGNRIRRVLWGIVYVLLFRPSPRNLHFWRNWLLRLFGAKLHPTSRVYPAARVWAPWMLTMAEHSCIGDGAEVYNPAGVTFGAWSTVSQRSFLCGATQDFDNPPHPDIASPLASGERCWLAADVYVGPGVTIADGTVVGARSSVFKDLPAWVVAVGTPARPVRERKLPGIAPVRAEAPVPAEAAS